MDFTSWLSYEINMSQILRARTLPLPVLMLCVLNSTHRLLTKSHQSLTNTVLIPEVREWKCSDVSATPSEAVHCSGNPDFYSRFLTSPSIWSILWLFSSTESRTASLDAGS